MLTVRVSILVTIHEACACKLYLQGLARDTKLHSTACISGKAILMPPSNVVLLDHTEGASRRQTTVLLLALIGHLTFERDAGHLWKHVRFRAIRVATLQ